MENEKKVLFEQTRGECYPWSSIISKTGDMIEIEFCRYNEIHSIEMPIDDLKKLLE